MAEQNAGQNKDELANLLGAMADGEHGDDSEPVEEETSPHLPPTPQPVAPPPTQEAVTAPPRIARPSTPDVGSSGSSRPAFPTITPSEPATAPAPEVPPPLPQPVRPIARPAAKVQRRPAARHFSQTLSFKRTIIPICLNVGAICILLPVVGFFSASTSPLSHFGGWVGAGFAAVGVVMFSVAAVTMAMVKHELARQASQPAPRPR